MKIINSIPHYGDHSPEVKIIQQVLIDYGITDLEIDGIFGKKTMRAVKEFQEKNGLDVDGIIGRQTMRAMNLELKIFVNESGFMVNDVINQFVAVAKNYDGELETQGKNRSPFIDIVNKWIGADIGSDYCISSICYILDKIMNSMNVEFDLPETAGTQKFWRGTKDEYKKASPQFGNICILYRLDDESHGHACIVLSEADENGTFKTFEFNTNKDGVSGVFHSERNLNGDEKFKLRGFVDVSKSIKFLDSNTIEQGSFSKPDWNYIAKNISLDAEINKLEYLKNICEKILQDRERFQKIEVSTDVPWKLIAAICFMESSLNFTKNFLNGQPLNQVTTIKPLHRGPWETFEDSAIEGLRGVSGRSKNYWTFGNQLSFAESYNGKGYRGRGIYSSYVTAYTNFSQEKGKYVRDGVFDLEKLVTRPGVAAIILMLNKMGF